jgi:predicted transcriptional regulator
MPTETVGARLDPRTIKDLDELAQETGRSRSEVVQLAVGKYLAESKALTLPVPKGLEERPSGAVLPPNEVEKFLDGTAAIEIVRDTPSHLNPGLAMILPAWEKSRATVVPVFITPDERPEPMAEERAVRLWLENWLERSLAIEPTLERLLALRTAGLLPSQETHRDRLRELREVLLRDGRRHRDLLNWENRILATSFTGFTKADAHQRWLEEQRDILIGLLRWELPGWEDAPVEGRDDPNDLGHWAFKVVRAIPEDVRRFILDSVPKTLVGEYRGPACWSKFAIAMRHLARAETSP